MEARTNGAYVVRAPVRKLRHPVAEEASKQVRLQHQVEIRRQQY